MKNAWTIAVKEYKSYFSTVTAYVVMGLFHVISGLYFFMGFKYFMDQGMQFQMGGGKAPSLVTGLINPIYYNMSVFLMMVLPFITMRVFSEEKKMHTLELLLTAPIRVTDIVLGKFLSAFLFVLTMIGITLIYPIILAIGGNLEWGPVLTTLLGILLMAGSFISVGVLCSCLTESVVIAAMTTWMVCIFLWIISWASQLAGPGWSEVLSYVSLINHYNNFAQGMINSVDVVFYLSFIFVSLFLTHRVLDSYRWR